MHKCEVRGKDSPRTVHGNNLLVLSTLFSRRALYHLHALSTTSYTSMRPCEVACTWMASIADGHDGPGGNKRCDDEGEFSGITIVYVGPICAA